MEGTTESELWQALWIWGDYDVSIGSSTVASGGDVDNGEAMQG